MKRLLILCVLLIGMTVPISGQAQTPTVETIRAQGTVDVTGVNVTCPNNLTIENGVEMVINMRAGFSYTATAIGIGGFDPVIAVTDGTNVLCNDDNDDAQAYAVNLPTTGLVEGSPFSAQSPFSYTGSGFGDISVIVGSFDNRAGEFVLFIEGLAVTNADGSGEGAGDPFSLNITPNVHLSGVPVTAYMISITDALDPLMTVVNDENTIIRFDNGDLFACDDAGSAGLCWGETVSLAGFGLNRGVRGALGGFGADAYMEVPTNLFGLGPQESGLITWRYTSYEQSTFGDYVAVFHFGTTASGPVEVADAPSGGQDQADAPATSGDAITQTGTISEEQPEQVYRFNGSTGDIVTITMVADDESELDTRLFLYTAASYEDDSDIASNDDAADSSVGSFNSQIAGFELPEDGEYVIVATRFRGEGDFTLTLEGIDSLAGDGGSEADSSTDSGAEVRQWAVSATGTSQYGEDDWSFAQATGEPNTELCGDYTTAWASASSTGSDTLALEFAEAVNPTEVNIYQTFNPGSIIRVELSNTETGEIIQVPDSADPPGNTDCPGVFTLDVSSITSPVDGVIIYFDQTIGGSWNEIDAVELVGTTGDTADATTDAPSGEKTAFTAEGLGISFSYPGEWTVIEAEPTFVVITDSMATLESIGADVVELTDEQFVIAVSNMEQYAELQDTIEATNAAVIEGFGDADDEDTTYGTSETIKLGGMEVVKTDVVTSGLDGFLYLVNVNGTYIILQAAAGDISNFEAAFDALVASLGLAG